MIISLWLFVIGVSLLGVLFFVSAYLDSNTENNEIKQVKLETEDPLAEVKKEVESEQRIHNLTFGYEAEGLYREQKRVPTDYEGKMNGFFKECFGNLSKWEIARLDKGTKQNNEITHSKLPVLKKQIIVLLRSGNLAVVQSYTKGDKFPLSGIIQSAFENKDMQWTWTLNGKGGDIKNHRNDIVSIVGDFD